MNGDRKLLDARFFFSLFSFFFFYNPWTVRLFLTRFETRYNTILDSKIVKFSLIFIVPIVSTSDYRSIIEMLNFFFFRGLYRFIRRGGGMLRHHIRQIFISKNRHVSRKIRFDSLLLKYLERCIRERITKYEVIRTRGICRVITCKNSISCLIFRQW